MMARRSIFNRLTTLAVLTAVAAVALLYIAARYVVEEHTRVNLIRMVDTDLAGLADIYASGGQAELERRLADRTGDAVQGLEARHYLIANGRGQRIAGDLRHFPPLSPQVSQGGFVVLPEGQPVFARSTRLAPDLELVVAHEYGDRGLLIRQLTQAFVLAGLAVVALLVSAGALASRRLRKRVFDLNQTFRSRGGGETVMPIGPATGDDELSELAGHVSLIIDRQAALVAALHHTSDQTAHELRTPLMHLDLRLQKLIEMSPEPERQQPLQVAREDIKHIIRMLESLLDIAESEADLGDQHTLPEHDISELAIAMADLFIESANDLGISLETAIASGIVMRCDAIQMTRLMAILLDNALKYVPAGGTVRLSLEPGPRLSVVDDGPGVPEPMRERIFERFQRAAPEPLGSNQRNDQDRRGGHGLGLALARAIAQRHGLGIRCEDHNPGAAFIIEPQRS